MFAKWVNLDRGGVNLHDKKYPVAIKIVEDYSNKSAINSVYNELLPDFDFFFAPTSSGFTNVAADVTDPAGKLMVTSAASATYVFKDRNSTFGAVPPSIQYLESSMGAFSSLGAKSVAVLKEDSYSGCDSYEDSFVTATKYNMSLFGYYPLNPASPSFSADFIELAQKFKDGGLETIIGCTYGILCYEVLSCRRI
jgi:ABC-type branched-subunit amino acid transport system substrate-binding protein